MSSIYTGPPGTKEYCNILLLLLAIIMNSKSECVCGMHGHLGLCDSVVADMTMIPQEESKFFFFVGGMVMGRNL